MRVFVYEYLSAGQPGAESLRREGRAMRDAALADLSACRGVEAVAMPEVSGEEEATFRDLARGCDAALVIAPEFDDLLATRAEWALEEGCRLLGPTPEGIRLSADKLAMRSLWQERGLATPKTLPFAPKSGVSAFPVVVKPRFGAGCLRTFRIDNQGDFSSFNEACPGDLLVQPYVPGDAASIAFLIGPGLDPAGEGVGERRVGGSVAVRSAKGRPFAERTATLPHAPSGIVPLLPASQRIEVLADGSMHYRGGRLPRTLPPAALDLAARAVACVPGLRGYVGVDLVMGAEPQVIEVNPRLTTSYIGLRQLARYNVMQAMLDVLDGRSPGALDYHPGEVTFHTDEPGD